MQGSNGYIPVVQLFWGCVLKKFSCCIGNKNPLGGDGIGEQYDDARNQGCHTQIYPEPVVSEEMSNFAGHPCCCANPQGLILVSQN